MRITSAIPGKVDFELDITKQHSFTSPAAFHPPTQSGFPHSLAHELQGPMPWVPQDFQHWNFGDSQEFAFDPVFTMTNFENSAMLAFAADEQNGPETYYMST